MASFTLSHILTTTAAAATISAVQDIYHLPLHAPYMSYQKGLPHEDFRRLFMGRPCYDPRRHLIVPELLPPSHFAQSPLLGGPPMERDILLYFRGDVGLHRQVSGSGSAGSHAPSTRTPTGHGRLRALGALCSFSSPALPPRSHQPTP